MTIGGTPGNPVLITINQGSQIPVTPGIALVIGESYCNPILGVIFSGARSHRNENPPGNLGNNNLRGRKTLTRIRICFLVK